MNTPITITPQSIFNVTIAICGAIITVSSATAIVIKCVQKFKYPNKIQDQRLDTIERDIKRIDERLEKGNIKFDADELRMNGLETSMSRSNKIIIKSLQALTDHALDGNNTSNLEESKKDLDAYLLNKI